MEDNNMYYEDVNFDYTNHIIEIKDNVFKDKWETTTLEKALQYCQDDTHRKHCKAIASLMYDINPDIGYGHDIILIEPRPKFEYKNYRRNNLKIVKYITNAQCDFKNAFVVIDIDFKNIKWLSLYKLNGLKSNIKDYFKSHSSSIFLVESSSGLGFHLAMSFHAETINNLTYLKAYSFYANEIGELTGIENFIKYVDFSVSKIEANFFVGMNSIDSYRQIQLRKPIQSLYVNYQKANYEIDINGEPSVNNELSTNSFYSNFLLTHYYKHIPKNCLAFNDYDKWIKMIFALVVSFPKNRDVAYFWFEKFSQLADPKKINKYENDQEFDRIFDYQPDAYIGINYILNQIFGYGYVENYIQYTYDDVKDYFENYYNKLNDMDIINSYDEKFIIDRYMSEKRDVLTNNDNLMIISPPNSGKSNFYINQSNMIFLTPTSILRDDLYTSTKSSYKIEAGEDIDTNYNNFIGNYDAIYKIRNSSLDLKKFTLVIDESHELFFSASPKFRHNVVNEIVESLNLFKNFVLLSGTPFDFNLGNIKFKRYYFTKNNNRTPLLEIVKTDSPLETMVNDILLTKGKQICFINDKNKIEKVKELINIKQPNRNVIVFNAFTKNGDEQQIVLKNNLLPENTILLGTQMILEGISFKDNDIDFMRFYQPILAEYIAQFSFRPRNEECFPTMVMYTKPKNYKLQKNSLPINAYKYLENKCQSHIENIINNGIESDNYGLVHENNYRRVTFINEEKKMELLPIKLFNKKEYEMDLLYLGELAIDLAGKNQSNDLLSLLYQLKKWNFNFKFSTKEKSELLKIHKQESMNKQISIIKNNFQEFINFENIDVKHKMLYKAFMVSKFINHSYLINMNDEDRVHFFNDDKLIKIILKVTVWASERELENLYLNDLVQQFKLEELVNWILLIKKHGIDKEISHNSLMNMLRLDQNLIKNVKAKLKLFFKIKSINKNGIRSVQFEYDDNSILNEIIIGVFENNVDNPF
jgi:hypothetical protein